MVKVRGTQILGVSDAQGRFTLKDVVPGDVSLSITAEKFVPIPDTKYTVEPRKALDVGKVRLLPYPAALGLYDGAGTTRLTEYPSSASQIDCIVNWAFLTARGLDIGATRANDLPVLPEAVFMAYLTGATNLQKLEIWGPVEKQKKCG